MNLAKLIAPCKYALNTDVIKFDIPTIKKMTKYDRDNIDQCHDMLEVILRAFYDGHKLPDFVKKGLYNLDELNMYWRLVVELIPKLIASTPFAWYLVPASRGYVHKNKRYSDFSANIIYLQDTESCETPFVHSRDGKFYLVVNDNYNKATVLLDEISEWQAHYISIFNVITNMGKDAETIGTENQPHEIFMNKITKKPTTTENKTDMIDIDKVDAAKVDDVSSNTGVSDAKVDAAKITTPSEVNFENYKLLLSKNSNNWFEPAQKEAKLKSINETYIAVEIDSNVLVFNTGRKYFCQKNNQQLICQNFALMT